MTDTTDAMQAGVQRAYALAEQGDYPCRPRAAYAQTTRRAERDSAFAGAGAAQHYRPAEPDDGGAAALCRSGQSGRPGNGDAARFAQIAQVRQSFSAGFERLSSISFSSSMKVLTSLNWR